MAQIISARGFGGTDQLDIVIDDVPSPGPDEVRIEVRAAAVNPADVKRLAGSFGTQEPPFRLGSEAAGVVVAVGANAVGPTGTPIAVGDEVIAYPAPGAFATELLLPASDVLPKPRALSFTEASGLLLAGTTAAHLLAATEVTAGDRVLVHGASGAVGALTLQLLRERGADAVGTGSKRSADVISRYGATPVLYGEGLADRVREIWPDGPTVALDCVGTDEALDVSVELVADRNRIATIAGFIHGAELGVRLLGGGPGADPGAELRNAARLDLVRLADEGRLEVPVARSYPLSQVATAFDLVASAHSGGKVVLTP